MSSGILRIERRASHETAAKNSLINLAGFGIPLLVGLITIPLIVRGFGIERFGVPALAWAVIGYFSLFNMGIGRRSRLFDGGRARGDISSNPHNKTLG